MALNFGGNSTDRAQKTSANGVLDTYPVTFCGWVRPTTITNAANIITTRGSTSGFGASFKMTSDTTGNLRVFINATTNVDYRTTGGTLTANKWWFVAAVCSFTAAETKMFAGDLNTLVTECSYGTTTDGATPTSSVQATINLGSQAPTAASPWVGDIGPFQMYTRKLTLGELQSIQYTNQMLTGCVGYWLPGDTGTTTLTDFSGSSNDLTNSGPVAADNPPLARFRRWMQNAIYRTIAAGGSSNGSWDYRRRRMAEYA